MKEKSIASIVFSRICGFLGFAVLLGLANIAQLFIDNIIFSDVVRFLNSSILLLLIIMVVGILTDISWAVMFPFNILAPVLSAINSIFLLYFILGIIEVVQMHTFDFMPPMLFTLIAPILFFVVLIFGYVTLVMKVLLPSPRKEKTKKCTKWGEVGEEFRLSILDSLKRFRKWLNKK